MLRTTVGQQLELLFIALESGELTLDEFSVRKRALLNGAQCQMSASTSGPERALGRIARWLIGSLRHGGAVLGFPFRLRLPFSCRYRAGSRRRVADFCAGLLPDLTHDEELTVDLHKPALLTTLPLPHLYFGRRSLLDRLAGADILHGTRRDRYVKGFDEPVQSRPYRYEAVWRPWSHSGRNVLARR
jgi:hypothetical protein